MFIKRKHVLVIIFSSIIVSIVFFSTLIGYNLYLQWQKDSIALNYRKTIFRLTADLFQKKLVISNLTVKKAKDEPFKEMAIIEGSITNNTDKGITSLLMEVSFIALDGEVKYKDNFYPLGRHNLLGNSTIFTLLPNTRSIFLEGETISFRHLLINCPTSLIEELSKKSNFAKKTKIDKVRIETSITGISVL